MIDFKYYTYGYNGMQRDNSKGLGSGYTTLFREYDTEIAHWRSPDPQAEGLPIRKTFYHCVVIK